MPTEKTNELPENPTEQESDVNSTESTSESNEFPENPTKQETEKSTEQRINRLNEGISNRYPDAFDMVDIYANGVRQDCYLLRQTHAEVPERDFLVIALTPKGILQLELDDKKLSLDPMKIVQEAYTEFLGDGLPMNKFIYREDFSPNDEGGYRVKLLNPLDMETIDPKTYKNWFYHIQNQYRPQEGPYFGPEEQEWLN